MLSENSIQLLTAYVDGELTGRQRTKVMRLLHDSSEARELLLQLQENAHRIKELPRHKLDASFAGEVVEIIAERQIKPERAALRVPLRWVPYALTAMAAAVLFVLAFGGALYFVYVNGQGGDNNLVKGPQPDPVPDNSSKAPPNDGDKPAPRKPPNPLIARVTEGVYQQYAAVIPPERGVDFAELKGDSQAAKQLVADIKKGDALQLDVTVHDNPLAVDRLAAVLKKYEVKLAVAPTSANKLKGDAGKGEFLVYAENLSHDEWTAILRELAAEEKKAASPFSKVTVTPLSNQDDQQVASLIGEDPTKRAKPDTNIIGKPGPKKKGNRVVMLLPQTPEPKASNEVRDFLLQPALPLPGSIRVLIRLRQE